MGIRTLLSKIPLLGNIFFENAISLSITPSNATPLKKDDRIMYIYKIILLSKV